MTFDDLTIQEQLTLAGLARLMLRADNQFSRAEATALGALAIELDEDVFWKLIDRAAELESQALRGMALDLHRREAQEFIYGHLFALGVVDMLVAEEGALLDWLVETWKLESESEPYRG